MKPTHHPTQRAAESSESGLFAHLAAPPVITIDGGAGSGKSSIASMLARRLEDLPVLDSGLWFRAIGLTAHDLGINPTDQASLAQLAQNIGFIPPSQDNPERVTVIVHNQGTELRTFHFTFDQLGTAIAGQRASEIGIYPEVRAVLKDAQREIARHGCVTAGRAQGSEVFGQLYEDQRQNQSVLRVLLFADLHVRAERRLQQFSADTSKSAHDLEKTTEDLRMRDHRDTSRLVAPLLTPEQALALGYLVIDTGRLNREQVVEVIVQAMRSKGLLRD